MALNLHKIKWIDYIGYISHTLQNIYMCPELLTHYVNDNRQVMRLRGIIIALCDDKFAADLDFHKQQTMSKKPNSALNKT